MLKGFSFLADVLHGKVLPDFKFFLGHYGRYPTGLIGDSTFRRYSWLIKCYNENTKDKQQRYHCTKNKNFRVSRKLRIWSHLLKKSLMENFMFCAVYFNKMLCSGRVCILKYIRHVERYISFFV